MDGFETTQEIRQIYSHHPHNMPTIVAMTPSNDLEDSVRCLSLGIDFCINKRVTLKELIFLLLKIPQLKSRQARITESAAILMLSNDKVDVSANTTISNSTDEFSSSGSMSFLADLTGSMPKITISDSHGLKNSEDKESSNEDAFQQSSKEISNGSSISTSHDELPKNESKPQTRPKRNSITSRS